MEDDEEDDLQKALRLSMQHETPEPKRSKAVDDGDAVAIDESPELKNRRLQRELMAAAAEKRMAAMVTSGSVNKSVSSSPVLTEKVEKEKENEKEKDKEKEKEESVEVLVVVMEEEKSVGDELSMEEARKLFLMVFGNDVSKGILSQWSNQGIRFSPDEETSMGLVQHEGGPCGVLAAIQAFVLKYLLFFPQEGKVESSTRALSVSRRLEETQNSVSNIFGSLTEETNSVSNIFRSLYIIIIFI